jgi:cell division protein FtsW
MVVFGLLMLFTSSMVISKERTRTQADPTGSATYYFFHQLLFGVIPGAIFGFLLSKFSLKFFRKAAVPLYILAILSLIIVFIPIFNYKAMGATSWIEIGGFTFQPSEFAKIAIIIYLAAFFDRKIKENKMKNMRQSLIPFLTILAPLGLLLILQPDMGTLGILALISLSMFFIAGAKFSHIFLLVIAGLVLVLICAQIFPHQAQRIFTFFSPEEDTLGMSYQVNQSLIGIGSGGILGVGVGNGIQKYNYLPEPIGDTIFSVWAEETGFFGSIIIISLYLILGWRGFIISKHAPDKFSQLFAIGIVSWILIQAFVNIMSVTGLIPFTGLPLPFISYGGTAMIAMLGAMGILINISKQTT